jgi:hypothetical protein
LHVGAHSGIDVTKITIVDCAHGVGAILYEDRICVHQTHDQQHRQVTCRMRGPSGGGPKREKFRKSIPETCPKGVTGKRGENEVCNTVGTIYTGLNILFYSVTRATMQLRRFGAQNP